MIIVKMFSSKNSRYSFSSMEERLERKKAMKLHLPRLRQLFAGMECDTIPHKKINTVIVVSEQGTSFTFSKICCEAFKNKLMQRYHGAKAERA